MSFHRSRNLVKLCLESGKQDADPKQCQKPTSPVQDSMTPSYPAQPDFVQIQFLDETNINTSNSLQISYIENFVTDNTLITDSLQMHTGLQEIIEYTLENTGSELTTMSNVDDQILTTTDTIRKSGSLEPAVQMSLTNESTLIQPSDLEFNNESFHSTELPTAEDLSTEKDSEYSPDKADSSSSDSSLSDVENTVPEMQRIRNIEDTEAYYGDMTADRRRRKKAEPGQWKKNLNKKLRMEGKPYLGYEALRGQKIQHNKNRPGRSMGPTCTSNFCKNSAVRRCDEFTENTRKDIFKAFWQSMDWSQRKIYVRNNVTVVGKKRATTTGPSRRGGTLKYFLSQTKEDNTTEKIPVCRKMFLNTLSLGTFTVQSWAKKCRSGILPSQENENRSRNITSREERTTQLEIIDDFFSSLPKLPSHYNRKDSNKIFIEPVFRNKSHLYEVYMKFCVDKSCIPFSRKKFDVLFSDKNIAIHKLKKDMCDTCLTYENGNLNEEEFQQHIMRKNNARQEKEIDKKEALKRKCILLNVDLQAVKVCPFLTASAIYYTTKLTLHNYSVYNVATHHATCYWFAETEADLSSSTFTSMLITYLEKHCLSENVPIIIYSDGCAAQNRNSVLSNALLNISLRHNVSVYQKFLEVGHTQMEGDSVHSCIERKLKNRIINLPSDYVTATKEARIKPFPYETIMLQYNFFLNYADPQTCRYSSIRPGRKAGDPKVTELKAIAYLPDGLIRVKLDYNNEWIELPQRPKRLPVIEHYEPLHTQQLPISDSKFKHLQELKCLLPQDCQPFYDSLPHI